MNLVIAVIAENIADQGIRFVFPSQIAARLWAQKTCTLGIARSVAARRFLAWDRFKEELINDKEPGRTPAAAVMRKLFADALLRKNAEAPFLKSLLPPEYAKEGGIFVPFIARLLPSLAYWEKLAGKAGQSGMDEEDRDYAVIKKEYSSFLARHKIFEPSWEEAGIREGNERYVIFFPELIEDFVEYDALLQEPKFIRVNAETTDGPKCLVYESAREEIRAAVLEMQRLHEEEGFPYEEMAISVPELEEMEPNLVKELSLRHIPFARRAGKKLGATGAGRLFPLISECAASLFSFNALKALVLNDRIPWKDREANKKLILFGIRYNCVSGYEQDGKYNDIWDEAFREGFGDGGKELRPYYQELNRRAKAFTDSPTFADLRKNYFAFRHSLLDMETISDEDNNILSRCIEELNLLIELEERFNEPSLIPASPFGFYISHINEVVYVSDDKKNGVNIYPWRTAAASPFGCHFVLNASQSAATVLYQSMKFLRPDKRKSLGLEDSDASGAFFTLCGPWESGSLKSRTRISASKMSFSGWAIPHSFFAGVNTVSASDAALANAAANATASTPAAAADPYREERRFWRERGSVLKKIHPLQKLSFDNWKSALALREKNYSFFSAPVPAETIVSGETKVSATSKVRELMSKEILDADGCLTVAPKPDLNEYYKCSIKWLYSRVFKVRKFSLEAELLDDMGLGSLYHKILEKLFSKIRNEEVFFISRRLPDYKRWAVEITEAVIKAEKAFKGPLAVPLVSPQSMGMAKKIAHILDLEAKYFNGYRVADLEMEVSYKSEGLLVKGVIDRVSLSPDRDPVIVDYKTTYLPDQTSLDELDKTPLSEFQMPLYVKLYEAELCSREPAAEASSAESEQCSVDSGKVKGAYFYSITGKKIKTVMGETLIRRAHAPDREKYGVVLEAAEKQIEEFSQRVKALDFVPREIKFAECLKCVYKTACRRIYSLNYSF